MPASLLTVTPLTASGISHVFDNIPYGPVAWYDATKIAGITSGTSLSAWTDVSGNANHLLQASAQSQPTYQTNIQNGLPVVRFPASTASAVCFMQNTFTLNQPVTVSIAFSYQTTAVGSRAVFDGKTNISMFLDNVNATIPNAGTQRIFAGTVLQEVSSTITNGSFYVMTGIFNGSASTFVISGSFSTTGNAGTANPGGITIGNRGTPASANALRCDIGEMIVYNKALTPAERASVETYLMTKWGAAV